MIEFIKADLILLYYALGFFSGALVSYITLNIIEK